MTRRAIALGIALVFMTAPDAGLARPLQEDVPAGDRGSDDATEVEIDIDVEVTLENAGQLTATLEDLQENINDQLGRYEDAERAVDSAVQKMADIDATIIDLQLKIETLQAKSDEVVAAAFVNPPTAGALDLMTTESVTDLAVKQTFLTMQANEDGSVLDDLADARGEHEEALQTQEERQQDAVNARDDAKEALADLDAALTQEAEFRLRVQGLLGEDGEIPEEFADEAADLTATLSEIEEATRAERARRAVEEQAKRDAASGAYICPVQLPTNFSDTWGAARSGGRSHEGTDVFASTGTPTVAPVSGRVEHRSSGLGGMSWYLYDDNGDTHYGAHLSQYAKQGVGRVEAGDIIGYVGSTGNAQASSPHLHYEFHPGGGGPINPYTKLAAACPNAT